MALVSLAGCGLIYNSSKQCTRGRRRPSSALALFMFRDATQECYMYSCRLLFNHEINVCFVWYRRGRGDEFSAAHIGVALG